MEDDPRSPSQGVHPALLQPEEGGDEENIKRIEAGELEGHEATGREGMSLLILINVSLYWKGNTCLKG